LSAARDRKQAQPKKTSPPHDVPDSITCRYDHYCQRNANKRAAMARPAVSE